VPSSLLLYNNYDSNNPGNIMSEKQKLIRKMIQMQKEFIAQERQGGMDPKDYFAPQSDHALSGYRESFTEIATRVGNLANEEKGSRR